MSSKRQQTMAKMTRERLVKERRDRKQEKRRQKKLEAAQGTQIAGDGARPAQTAEEATEG
jgi:hypothetical protein